MYKVLGDFFVLIEIVDKGFKKQFWRGISFKAKRVYLYRLWIRVLKYSFGGVYHSRRRGYLYRLNILR
jgi:hypothetical protein